MVSLRTKRMSSKAFNRTYDLAHLLPIDLADLKNWSKEGAVGPRRRQRPWQEVAAAAAAAVRQGDSLESVLSISSTSYPSTAVVPPFGGTREVSSLLEQTRASEDT